MSAPGQSISEQDRLVQENARLRGDLLTIASRVSHDLRTPLGSILSAGELMREILLEKDPASLVLIEPLFSSVEELQRMIKGISMVTKASAQPIPKTSLKMDDVVNEVLQEFENRILKKQADVKSPVVWPEVEGVPGWLAFVWRQLMLNALQHGGLKIELGWRLEKNEHQFWICDNGPGVPEQSRRQLFQAYDSLHQPDSKRGLGLSVVQRLVALQGGHCGYDHQPGMAGFFFTLPTTTATL